MAPATAIATTEVKIVTEVRVIRAISVAAGTTAVVMAEGEAEAEEQAAGLPPTQIALSNQAA